jgi:hypothetical protein
MKDLRRRKITGMQILPQLLKFGFDLLEYGCIALIALRILSRARGEQIAAKDANDRHICTSSKNLRTKSDFLVVEACSSIGSPNHLHTLAGKTNGKAALLLRHAACQSREIKRND